MHIITVHNTTVHRISGKARGVVCCSHIHSSNRAGNQQQQTDETDNIGNSIITAQRLKNAVSI